MNIGENALLLIAIMRNARDLDIARLLGWYRIPLKSSPKIVSVDYLAFYQTAAFDVVERWKINFIAKVLGHELTTRFDLLHEEKDHPRANEEYFKIQIGPLLKLPEPIIAEKWRRITFFYTTGNRFNSAKTINDLVIHNDEREFLWRALREKAVQSQEYSADKLSIDQIDPSILKYLVLKSNK